MNEMDVVVRYKAGDEIVQDVSCDSKYMKEAMVRVAESIRMKYDELGVDRDTYIYLMMDNAGGHGTDECVRDYTRKLKDDYNIIIIQQCPRSPCTNTLDLGVWRTLQSHVEKMHKTCVNELNALAETVERAWGEKSLDDSIINVFEKIKTVLDIIIKDDGSIQRCETHYRGAKRNELVLTNEDREKLLTWHAEAMEEASRNAVIATDGGDDGDESADDL